MKSPFQNFPISLLLVQVAWVWAGVGFLVVVVSWHSLSHCGMGLASLLVVVALSLRWRALDRPNICLDKGVAEESKSGSENNICLV